MVRTMKDSGVEWIGEIPETWSTKRVKYIFTKKDAKAEQEDPVVLSLARSGVKVRDISSNEGQLAASYYNYNPVDIGDLLLNPMDLYSGANCSISKVEGVISPAYVNLRNKTGYNSVYYDYFFKTMYWSFALFSLGKGVSFDNRWTLGNDALFNIKLPSPSLAEQNKIAMFLDEKCGAIDEIITKTEQSIEEYKKLKQSVITKAVTKGIRPNRPMQDSNIEWIDEIPTDWEIKKLKFVFEIKKEIAGKEGYTVLSITQTGIKPKNITSNEGQLASDYSKYQLVNKGDFAMNHMDLLTGWVDISKYDGVTSPDYRVFRLKRMNNCNRYFLYMMQLCYLNKIFYGLGQGVSGFGRWRLPADMFLNFLIPIPPIDEQKEIADYLDEKCAEIDTLIEKKQQFLAEMANYKKSLIYEYVTGKKEVA